MAAVGGIARLFTRVFKQALPFPGDSVYEVAIPRADRGANHPQSRGMCQGLTTGIHGLLSAASLGQQPNTSISLLPSPYGDKTWLVLKKA